MALKQPANEFVDLAFSGAEFLLTGPNGAILRFQGLAPVEVDWPEICNILGRCGVPSELVDVLCNEFANRTEMLCLAHAIAKRAVRC